MTLALLAELGCCFVIEIIVGVYAFVLDIDMAPGSCVNILLTYFILFYFRAFVVRDHIYFFHFIYPH